MPEDQEHAAVPRQGPGVQIDRVEPGLREEIRLENLCGGHREQEVEAEGSEPLDILRRIHVGNDARGNTVARGDSPNRTGPASRWQEDVLSLHARVAEREAGEVERTVEVIELAREGRQCFLIERGCGVDTRDDEPALR